MRFYLLACAARTNSPQRLNKLLGRARNRADAYALLLADWPALVAEFAREAELIDARYRQCLRQLCRDRRAGRGRNPPTRGRADAKSQ